MHGVEAAEFAELCLKLGASVCTDHAWVSKEENHNVRCSIMALEDSEGSLETMGNLKKQLMRTR